VPCARCGRLQTDPAKGKSNWARAVIDKKQILLCPDCQREDPTWVESVSKCPKCGSIRLSMMLGDVVCRECGTTFAAEAPDSESAGGI
jgi:ribosomal protein S27E